MTETTSLPVIPDSRRDDLLRLEKIQQSQLNLFMAGNQFMVMQELVSAFKQLYPKIRHIYCQTLPPGLQLKQILAGGALFRGQCIDVMADIYTSVNEKAMKRLAEVQKIAPGSHRLYLHNRLVLLVPAANPASIAAVSDLGDDHVRISQPDPANEDIAYHIMNMYRDAGGNALVHRIMEEKTGRRDDHHDRGASSGNTAAVAKRDCRRRSRVGYGRRARPFSQSARYRHRTRIRSGPATSDQLLYL
jgi:molybdate transport system substrate-binding protein